MHFTKKEIREAISIRVANRIAGKNCPLLDATHAIKRLKDILEYGEITGSPNNRVLRTNSDCYGFVKRGVLSRATEYSSPFTDNLSNSSELKNRYDLEWGKIVESFHEKINKIEDKYPPAPNHVAKRLEEARVAAKVLIWELETLIDNISKIFLNN